MPADDFTVNFAITGRGKDLLAIGADGGVVQLQWFAAPARCLRHRAGTEDRDQFLQLRRYHVVVGIGDGTTTNLAQLTLTSGIEPRLAFTPPKSGDDYPQVTDNSSGPRKIGSYAAKMYRLSDDAVRRALVAQSHAYGVVDVGLTANSIELSFNEPIAIDIWAVVLKNSSGEAMQLAYENGRSDRPASLRALPSIWTR